jgi:sugar O-acyltransferase (sialic acid O-acetyltransferase NeuD family)
VDDLVIFGTGGAGRDAEQIVRDINAERSTYNLLGYLDGNAKAHGADVHGLPVLGDLDWLVEHPAVHVAVAVGNTPSRRRLVLRLESQGHSRFATLIHPLAWVGKWVKVGEGSTLYPGCMLTTDIQVGRFVLLNVGTKLGHDTVAEDFVTLAPAATVSGNVRIGTGCDLGTNCSVNQKLQLGQWSIVGAGAAVVRDVPENVTMVGVPARILRTRPAGWHLGE